MEATQPGPHTSLQRTGQFTFTAMIVAKATPENWAQPTVLLRLVEKNGAETMLTATKDARNTCVALEKWRIYDFRLKGTCVRLSNSGSRYGIKCPLEVRLAFPCSPTLATSAWTPNIPYKFRDWETFTQLQDQELLDLLGRVSEPLRIVPTKTYLKKALLSLESGRFVQTIELLGDASGLAARTGDIIAFSGLRTKEYQRERTFETTLLTVIDINPPKVPPVPETDHDTPKRKAMRMTEGPVIQIAEVQSTATSLQHSEAQGIETQPVDMFLKASFTPLNETFFDEDPPVVGEEDARIMRWKATLKDDTGEISVTVWDKPCFTIFEQTATKVMELWEDGVQNDHKRDTILAALNKNLTNVYHASCTMKIWKFGTRTPQIQAQLHVNNVQSI